MKAAFRCPTCTAEFEVESSPSAPFCSVRCQQIDLRRWLNEEYGLLWEPEDAAAEEVPELDEEAEEERT